MARTGGKCHLDETDAWKENAVANDVMREERFGRGCKSARENDLIIRNRLSQPWRSRKPPQARVIAISATGVVRAIAIERSIRKAARLRPHTGISLVLEHPVGDDATPPKGARACRLRSTFIHRIGINRRM